MLKIHEGDNLTILHAMPDASVDLIYIDPPFNTGRLQTRKQLRTVRDEESGDRIGFQGKKYRSEEVGRMAYADRFDDFLAFLKPRFVEARRVLKAHGSFFLHMDYREVHYAKVMLDVIFGRDSFMNEIIWAYDYGGRTRSKWPAKHNTILWYTKDPANYTFNYDEMDRIPYMAPGLVTPEKAARGKTPTDVWWHTIVSPNGKEKTGYPTQKPLGILERIIKVHSNAGDQCLDFFAGAGSFGEAAVKNGRECVLVDENPEAIAVMMQRFKVYSPILHGSSGLPDTASV